MFTSNDILDRLRGGESVDDIMNNITAIMTEATKTYENEEANKTLKNAKIKTMYTILTDIYNYILDFCVDSTSSKARDFIDTLFEQITPEDAVEFVDKIVNELKNDPDVEMVLDLLSENSDIESLFKAPVAKKEAPVKLTKSDDDVLNEFLKTFNLK